MDGSYVVPGLLALITLIGNAYLMKYMISDMKIKQEGLFKRLDMHGDDIITLKTKSELAMTAKDVDDKYVSKELFRQQAKHLDQRFDSLEKGQVEILKYIRDSTKHESN